MLPYQDHVFPTAGGDLLATLREHPELLRRSLDGWLASRKGEVDLSSLILLERTGVDHGDIVLAFQETQWLACQLETGRQRHQARLRYRLQEDSLVLSTLPRDAFGERQDEI